MAGDISQRLLDLSAAYRFEDRDRVEAFLRVHHDLLPSVERSEARVLELFPEAELWLAVDLDEGDEDAAEEERLFILIETTLDPGDALNRLEKLDEAWAASLWEEAGGRVVIDLKA